MKNFRELRVGIITLQIIFLLAGCAPVGINSTEGPSATIVQTSPTQISVFNEPVTPTVAGEEITTQLPIEFRTIYYLTALINYDDHTLLVEEEIVYQNRTGEELFEIPLIYPEVETTKIEILKLSTEDNPITGANEKNGVFVLTLQDSITNLQLLVIKIQYTIGIPKLRGPLGYTDNQINLNDWYFSIPVYNENSGWMTNERSGMGEYRVYEKSDFHITLTMESSQDLQIAAPAEGIKNGNTYEYHYLNVRDFSFSMSSNYQVFFKDFGSFSIECYSFSKSFKAAEAVIENSGKALIFYGNLFGEKYPHERLVIVEADFPDGLERDGLYYLSQDYFSTYDGTSRNYLIMLSAHETAHQWWYGMVGNDQAIDPWLDEALCTYSEVMLYEYLYPDDAAWWWANRVYAYQPEGLVDSTIYDHGTTRGYINAVYLRGAIFLHEIRQLEGDEAFLQAIQRYFLVNIDSIASTESFFIQFPDLSDSTITGEYFSP